MTSADGSSQQGWVADSALNLFSEGNRSKVEAVLTRPGAVVFGWHYHFKGGSSRTDVVFTDLDEYGASIEQAKPGDHFTLFDLDALASLAFLRSVPVESTDGRWLTQADWELLEQRARDGQYFVLVRRFIAPTGAIEVEVLEPTAPEDEWLAELDSDVRTEPGERLGWDDEIFDAGLSDPSVVTPTPGERRVHALVDAKRPNDSGEVPRSGPY